MPGVTMSMGNQATTAISNLSATAPTGGFSNPQGTGNLGATTANVFSDHFSQPKLRCDSLEARVKELTARGEDATLKINGYSFALLREFDTFFNEDVLRLNTPGAADESFKLHICFLDGCGLLVLAYNDKGESLTKDIAALKNLAQKAGYKGVKSMIVDNTYSKLLPECFGKSLTCVTQHPLPIFPRSSFSIHRSITPHGGTR